MSQLIVWIDIPVKDLDRAKKFYSGVLDEDLEIQEFTEMRIAMLPGNTGCLFESERDIQNDNGPLLYFNVNGRLDDAEAKVKDLGGEVIDGKHSIGQYGFRTLAKDSEGNRIALHSES